MKKKIGRIKNNSTLYLNSECAYFLCIHLMKYIQNFKILQNIVNALLIFTFNFSVYTKEIL